MIISTKRDPCFRIMASLPRRIETMSRPAMNLKEKRRKERKNHSHSTSPLVISTYPAIDTQPQPLATVAKTNSTSAFNFELRSQCHPYLLTHHHCLPQPRHIHFLRSWLQQLWSPLFPILETQVSTLTLPPPPGQIEVCFRWGNGVYNCAS